MVNEEELRAEIKVLVARYNDTNKKDKKKVLYLEIMKLEVLLEKIKE